MNALGIALVWGAVQLTLFTLVAAAVYCVARRRGPAAGSLAALSSLVVALGISALTLSPWPRWYNLARQKPLDTEQHVRSLAASQTTAGQGAAAAGAADPAAGPAEVAGSRGPTPHQQFFYSEAFWNALWDDLRSAPPQAGRQAAWRWPAGLALFLLAGMGLGLCRLVIGLIAVQRDRRRTRLIGDDSLRGLARQIAQAMGCRTDIELRHSSRLATPATFGWLRPTVLLPDAWRQWTPEERRVVLAHEIAHIARRDYVTWIAAQCSLACHFYHPLVHWLVGRLRFEQELAADALGAQFSGGRQPYLTTLARMALIQDNRRAAWATRPFLPRRGMLLRRIEMLRYTNPLRYVSLGPWPRAALIGGLIASGLFVAGLRGPAGTAALAEPGDETRPRKPLTLAQVERATDRRPSPNQAGPGSNTDSSIDLSYVPKDSLALIVLKPAEILSRPQAKQLLHTLNQQLSLEADYGLPFDKLESVQIAIVDSSPPAPPGRPLTPQEAFARHSPAAVFIVRSSAPDDWSKFTSAVAPKADEASYLGQTYSKVAAPADLAYFTPDDRTIVLGGQRQVMAQILSARRPKQHAWAAKLEPVADNPLVVMVDVKAVRRVLPQARPQGPQGALFAGFAPLWEDIDTLVAGAKLDEGLVVEAIAACQSAEQAQRVYETGQAAITLARNAFGEVKKQIVGAPPEAAGAMLLFAEAAEELLSSARINQGQDEPNTVHVAAASSLGTFAALHTLLPAVGAARQAAGRAQSANNLRQIALAMHNYHDVHGKLPSAVVLGPDGKTPHSWRVEFLPYLEQAELYKQYRMDEPWDSENNLKVLEKMPTVFRAPGADPNSHNTSYFLLTGAVTPFEGTRSTGFSEIRDGTSYTIMAVEARRDIPWTKPEDIAYDPDEPLPELGGYFSGGFNVAMMDGSVRFLAREGKPGQPAVSESLLRALLTMAGGEAVQVP
ncbi:MAG: M56 family metallopeptidase [Pirellulales bacterium]